MHSFGKENRWQTSYGHTLTGVRVQAPSALGFKRFRGFKGWRWAPLNFLKAPSYEKNFTNAGPPQGTTTCAYCTAAYEESVSRCFILPPEQGWQGNTSHTSEHILKERSDAQNIVSRFPCGDTTCRHQAAITLGPKARQPSRPQGVSTGVAPSTLTPQVCPRAQPDRGRRAQRANQQNAYYAI